MYQPFGSTQNTVCSPGVQINTFKGKWRSKPFLIQYHIRILQGKSTKVILLPALFPREVLNARRLSLKLCSQGRYGVFLKALLKMSPRHCDVISFVLATLTLKFTKVFHSLLVQELLTPEFFANLMPVSTEVTWTGVLYLAVPLEM